MKIYFVVVFFLGISLSSFSQHYEMLNSYRVDVHGNFTSNGFVQIDSSKNEIKFAYVGKNDTTIYLTCYFTNEEIGSDQCNKMLYEILCNDCFKENLASLINKKGEWVEAERNYYVSNKRLGFELSNNKDKASDVKTMRITNTPIENSIATVCFETKTMKTALWKKIVKK